MKKLILAMMSLLLVLTLASCNFTYTVIENFNNNANESTTEPASTTTPTETEESLTQTETTEPETSELETSELETSEPEASEPEASEPEASEPEASEPETSEPEASEPEVSEPEVSEPEVSEPEASEPEASEPEVSEPEVSEPENNNPPSSGNIDNGVLKDTSTDVMDIPANMEMLEDKIATEDTNGESIQATVVLYTLDGDVVNWKTENDFLYVITKGNNRLVVINSQTMEPIYNVPLAGVPAEMNIVGDKIYISMPDLYKIDIFSKSTGTKESSLYFDREVSSFALDGEYIYYSEHDQHCEVFKMNLATGAEQKIQTGNVYSFYYPKVYLNQEDRILYIGESGSSGSAIYYFDADTLALKSVFKKDNYGITNHTRDIFHVGDEIYWGNYCLSDTNARELVGRYGTASYGSVTYASEELVSTYEGLFLAETYECVINYFDAGFNFEYLIVTESYNFFFRQRSLDKNIIIGINFDIQ